MTTNTQDIDISTSGLPKRYRFLGKLGSGGMADVFLGIQHGEKDFSRLVAVKRLHKDAISAAIKDPIQLFVDEARVIATLNHPHIVKVYDLLPHDDSALIIMEYVDGETLQTLMAETVRQHQQIPLPLICRWVVEAAEALHYAHQAVSLEGEPLRLVHRDIDMRNIMVDPNGYLKIIDFGVAQTITKQNAETGSYSFMGKISYAAPELFSSPEIIDHRVDLYALGLVFHALITQRKPYPSKLASTTTELVHKIMCEPLLAPTSVNHQLPKALDALIATATHKDPEKRFQSGEAFADAVEAFARDHGGLATPQEAKRWYQTHFADRVAMRQSFVQNAMERAMQLVQSEQIIEEEPERESLTPSLILSNVPSDDEDVTFEYTEAYDEKATSVMRYPSMRPRWQSKTVIAACLLLMLAIGGITIRHFKTSRDATVSPPAQEIINISNAQASHLPRKKVLESPEPAAPKYPDTAKSTDSPDRVSHSLEESVSVRQDAPLPDVPQNRHRYSAKQSLKSSPKPLHQPSKESTVKINDSIVEAGILGKQNRRTIRVYTHYDMKNRAHHRLPDATGKPSAPVKGLRLLESYD